MPETPPVKVDKWVVPPYFWPETQSLMQIMLSVSSVALVWYIVKALLTEGGLKIDPTVRDLVVFILGIIFGCHKDVYGFTFGSSAGQKRQGEVITKSLEDKDRIIASNVVTAAQTNSDALAAATMVAPLAAKAEAPPAAAAAAPAAARDAVEDALKDLAKTGQAKPGEDR